MNGGTGNFLLEKAEAFALRIVRREGLSPEAAMDKLYHSELFAKLNNPATGLYSESGGYLYAMFVEG